jgi:hypothetical protein
LEALQRRRLAAESWNRGLSNVTASRLQRTKWLMKACLHRHLPKDMLRYGNDRSLRARMITLEKEWRIRSGKRTASIPWALNDVVTGFWAGGE